ncbi:MAG TPA: tetratricopeptide repeat protein [Thiolapillus brandeum]|uniref:Tetratricopeptide repeat protein n=1 Tax=Thiolapillus brandeum TaxID=1076588 RepID=A0A831KCH8_9GAMM|nr:tetratricopeptide repeat protein [Thiolapillus brandeum]
MNAFRVLFLLLLLFGSQSFAGTLSERTYKHLTAIHELMGENKYKEALERLDELLPRVRKHKYEYATIMQTYGFAYAAQDQYKKAINAFEEALKTEALPEQVQLNMRYNLAQLFASASDWKSAAKAYEQWLAVAEKPSADSYAFGATIYAQLKQYDKAIPKIRKAIALAGKPRENWYQLLLSMLYQKKQYSQAAQVLETMVAFWPEKKQYWKQLSGVYFTLKKNRRSLAVLELAHKQGFLEKERELMNLVNMYLLQGIPYKAARILEQEMEAGRIQRTGKNLQKLGEAWMRAKETDEALKELQVAAQVQKKGVLYLRLAQLHTDKENWSKVIELANQALSVGGLKNPGDAWLLKGMALYETGKKQGAVASFSKALKYRKSKHQASQWLAHIRTEDS